MRFRIYGPFEIKRKMNGLIDFRGEELKEFWDEVDDAEDGLADACGCYMFATTSANGAKPHYVGRTTARSFRQECSSPHVIHHVNEVVAGKQKRSPQLFLIAKLTRSGSFTKPSKAGQSDINFLENYFIGLALARNPELRNRRQTKFLSELEVEGFLNNGQGRPSPSATHLKKLLGGKGTAK
jgi:hypothetical protein